MDNVWQRAARRITSAEPAIVLLAAPALLFPTPRRLLVAGVVLAIASLAARIATGRAVPATPLNLALSLLLVMVAVSLWATFDVMGSLGKVAGVVLGVTWYWAVVRWIATEDRLRQATRAFVIAGAGLAVVGLLGTNWFDKFPIVGAIVARLPRVIRGVPGAEEGFHPNAVAGCLVLFIPMQVALCWRPRGAIRRIGEMALLGLTLGTLILTQSRGAWLGIAAAGLAALCWSGRATRWIAVAVVTVLIAATVAAGPRRMIDLAISRSGPGMAANVDGRVELWSRAIWGIEDFPITGMGMNTFRRIMPVLYPSMLVSPDYDVAHAHNHFLQAALDLGIPGLVAYMSIWLLLGAMAVAAYRGSRDADHRALAADHRALAAALGAGLIAHFVFSTTDAIPLGAKVGITFWFAMALLTALHALVVTPDPAATRSIADRRGSPELPL